MNKIEISNINTEALLVVIDYLVQSEKQSYDEYVLNEFEDMLCGEYSDTQFTLTKEFYDSPKVNHIYAVARRLKDSIFA